MEYGVIEGMLYSLINAGNEFKQRFFTMHILSLTETVTLTQGANNRLSVISNF